MHQRNYSISRFRIDFYLSYSLLFFVVLSNVSRYSTRMKFCCIWFGFCPLNRTTRININRININLNDYYNPVIDYYNPIIDYYNPVIDYYNPLLRFEPCPNQLGLILI